MMKGRLLALLSAICAVLLSCSCSQARGSRVRQYKVEVVAEYPHDPSSYTQGLFFHDGKLYESTGQYGESTYRIVDLATGKALKRLDFAHKYFVEGSVVLGSDLYVLTWQNQVAFIYDAATLEYKTSYSYPREGWGLTTDGESLIASDGSSFIYFMDKNFQQQRRIRVTLDGRPVDMLNELEYIDGRIWANVYLTDDIMIINPQTGLVEGVVNCKGLLPRQLRTPKTDVLNGIARDPSDGAIYLTGKYWSKLYKVKLVEVK